MLTRSLLNSAGISVAFAVAAAVAAPAHASGMPLTVTVPSAMPLAAVALNQMRCDQAAPFAGSTALASPSPAPTMAGPFPSKSAAIVGGQMSALERMRLTQGSPDASAHSAAALAPTTAALGAKTAAMIPAALRPAGRSDIESSASNCVLGGSLAPIAAPFTAPAAPARPVVTTRGDFLGTERVKIGRTRFDAKWAKVSGKGLSQRDLGATIGAVPRDRLALLKRVNRWVNHAITYRDDRADSWAAARATLSTRRGDCEDFAILKLHMLAAAGIAKDDMMLTLARDTVRRLDHAVLLVRVGQAAPDGRDQWMMLDMQTDRLLPANGDYGYRPVMSFAGANRFLHGVKLQKPVS